MLDVDGRRAQHSRSMSALPAMEPNVGRREARSSAGLAAIALFTLGKGLLLLLSGASLLRLIDAEIVSVLSPLLDVLHLPTQTRVIHALMLTLGALPSPQLLLLAGVTVAYALVLMAEGFGLWAQQAWAAYMTILSTCLLFPVEAADAMRRPSWLGALVLLVNGIIVADLVRRLAEEELSEPPPVPRLQGNA